MTRWHPGHKVCRSVCRAWLGPGADAVSRVVETHRSGEGLSRATTQDKEVMGVGIIGGAYEWDRGLGTLYDLEALLGRKGTD